MREIKFRLWCKDLEEMTEIEKMGFENNQLWYIGCIDHDKEETYFPENDDHVLMQYTGLKDKNGKEIYEGDIVQQNFKDVYNQSQAFVGEVVYSDCVYWLKNDDEYTFLYDEHGIYNSIVIGNIYENPELLGDSK